MHVVLVSPQIPPNTGNIARLCAGTDTQLHLVKPLGFSLEDRYLKRAGLDYWPHVKLHVHENLEEVLALAEDQPMAFYSTHAQQPYTGFTAHEDAWLVFGRETSGLGKQSRARFAEHLFRIPITTNVRSLNLANSVAIVLYDALRQLDFPLND